MTPKLAHLFLVRNDLNQESLWKSFFSTNEGKCSIYVHAKWPEQVSSQWLKNRLIRSTCNTEYAQSSLVEAEFLLLAEAFLEPANKYFLLHSESCVPIRTFDFVYDSIFKTGKSWLFYHNANMERYNRVDNTAIPREHFFKSSQFFCLTRDHVRFLLNNVCLKSWTSSWCADEHYIPTVLSMHGKLLECFRQDLTFTCWIPKSHSPVEFEIITDDVLKKLSTTRALFARKFTTSSDIWRYCPFPMSHPMSQVVLG